MSVFSVLTLSAVLSKAHKSAAASHYGVRLSISMSNAVTEHTHKTHPAKREGTVCVCVQARERERERGVGGHA